jgi:hypothetical protein
MDIYPLRAIPVFALILCLISGSIVIINPNNYKHALAQQQEQEQQENKQSALSIVGSMRENNHNLTATNRPPLNAKSTYYTFTRNRSEVSTPENNSHTNEFGKGTRIALINPTFTSAAYNNSFYVFYEKHSNTLHGVNVTSDLDLLSSTVINNKKELSSSVSSMIYLLKNIKWVTSQPNITLLTDEDVDKGIIFEKNNSSSNDIAKTNSSSNSDNYINVYDIIILGHQEYVTQKEYDNLKQFVRSGGTMIILDGNVFYAEVRYDKNTQTVTLVKGHSWAFNGISAWRSVPERWAKETSEWVGSNYLCYSCNIRFTNDPFEYIHHEEQYITNPHDIILMNYNASLSDYPIQTRPVIATYELNYQKGRVIALGIYSDDVLR